MLSVVIGLVWLAGVVSAASAPIVLPLFAKPRHEHRYSTVSVTTTSSSSKAIAPQGTYYLSGCPQYDFSANLVIGGQTLAVIVDTGSSTTAVASNMCHNCPGVPAVYTVSSTAVNQQEQVFEQFLGGSGWAALVYSDLVHFPGLPSFRMNFGAIVVQSGGFFSDNPCVNQPAGITYDGILGMGYPGAAVGTTDALWTVMNSSGILDHNLFAILLCEDVGILWFSSYDTNYTVPNAITQYAPITTDTIYGVDLNDMLVNNVSLGFGPSSFGTAYVDSGTTVLVLPPLVYTAFVKSLNNNTAFTTYFGHNYWSLGLCQTANPVLNTSALNDILPPITFKLGGGATLTLKAISSYLVEVPFNGRVFYCPGAVDSGSSKTQYTILGWSVMNQFTTIFDIENTRIGFVPITVDACAKAFNASGASPFISAATSYNEQNLAYAGMFSLILFCLCSWLF